MKEYFQRLYNELTREKFKVLVLGITVTALMVIILIPLLALLQKSLVDEKGTFTLNNFIRFFSETGLLKPLLNTMVVAISVTFFSILVAIPMAWGVGRTDMPLKNLIRAMATIAFVIPSFISVIAWIGLLGPNMGTINVFFREVLYIPLRLNIFTMRGLIFVLAAHFFPLVFFSVLTALENMNPSYEEGARISGARPIQVVVGVTLPLIGPAVFTGGMLVFLDSLAAFGAPAALGLPGGFHVLTTKIYELFQFPPQFGLAAVCATPIVGFTALGLIIQRIYIGRRQFTTVSGRATHPEIIDIGGWRYVVLGFSLAVLVIAVILPVLFLLVTSLTLTWGKPFTLDNFTTANYNVLLDRTSYVFNSVVNSFILAPSTATITIFVGVIIGWIVERSRVPGRSILTFLATVTFAFPGIALAVGLIFAYSHPPVALYGTLWILLVAYVAHRIPFAFLFTRNSFRQIAEDLEEAARITGGSWLSSIKDVTLPLLKTATASTWILIFSVCLRELPMSVLLYTSGTETMAVSIYLLVDNGDLEKASAISCFILAISVGSVFLVKRITGKGVLEV
jgi:iron(III) transport system permease protein